MIELIPDLSYVVNKLFEQDTEWPIVGLFGYLFIFGITGLIFARSKDNMDISSIKSMEEGVESLPDVQKIEKEQKFSLMTWIFHRKLMIYTNKPTFCSVYCMMLQQLHPLLAIGWNFDITLKRLDRVIVLIFRIILCIPICYIGLDGLQIDNLDTWMLPLNMIITCSICIVLLLPLPSWIFNSCRVKYRLHNLVLSEEMPVDQKQKQLYINSKLSICQLMMIDSLPFEQIQEGLLTKVKKMSRVQIERIEPS